MIKSMAPFDWRSILTCRSFLFQESARITVVNCFLLILAGKKKYIKNACRKSFGQRSKKVKTYDRRKMAWFPFHENVALKVQNKHWNATYFIPVSVPRLCCHNLETFMSSFCANMNVCPVKFSIN